VHNDSFIHLSNLQNNIQMLNFYTHWNVFWGLKCSLFFFQEINDILIKIYMHKYNTILFETYQNNDWNIQKSININNDNLWFLSKQKKSRFEVSSVVNCRNFPRQLTAEISSTINFYRFTSSTVNCRNIFLSFTYVFRSFQIREHQFTTYGS